MPQVDGYKASRQIREQDDNADIPIIALTADVEQGVQDKCKAAGMDDYLSKPFTQRALTSMLIKWLKEKKPSDSRAH